MNCIDYGVLARAVVFYRNQRFSQVEVPWWVTKEISAITRPPQADDYELSINKKVLVASGEQSFLSLINKGHLPEGSYFTVTPCFRNEPIDFTHNKHFIKLELIKFGTIVDPEQEVLKMVDTASSFFCSEVPDLASQIEVRITNPAEFGMDLVLVTKRGDIELGSYGFRTCEFCNWVYGTGVAEPRFSKSIKFAKK